MDSAPVAVRRQRSPTMTLMEVPADSPQRTATLSTAVFNLVSTIVGGGVLSLPFAISVQGVAGGVLSLLASAVASDFSIYILIASSRSRGARGYEDVAAAALGEPARVLTVLLIFALTFLVTVAYTVLCGDLLAALVDVFSGSVIKEAESRPYVIAAYIVAVAPICFFRKMDALRFTSILSVVSVFVLGLVTAYKLATNGILRPVPWDPEHNSSSLSPAAAADPTMYYSSYSGQADPNTMFSNHSNGTSGSGGGGGGDLPPLGTIIWWPTSFQDAIYAAPIESVAFLCHFNVLPMQDELIRPTRARVQRVTHTTMGICLFLYTSIAVTGYLRFTSSTCGDYLNNFPNSDKIVTVGRIGLLLTLYCSFPLVVLPARATLSRLVSICCCAAAGGRAAASGSSESLDGDDDDADALSADPALISSPQQTLLEHQLLSPMGSFIADSPYLPGQRRRGGNEGTRTAALNGSDHPVTVRSYGTVGDANGDTPAGAAGKPKSEEDSTVRHVVLTVFMIASAFLLGLKVDSVVTIWSLAGSSVAMMIAYVLPAVFYIKLRSDVPFNRRILGAWVLLFFSVVLIGLTSWQAIAQISRPNCPERGK
jgi:amino acid permease